MAAISTVLFVLVSNLSKAALKWGGERGGAGSVINLFIGNELYCDTPRVCYHLQDLHKNEGHPVKIEVHEVDVTKPESLVGLVRKNAVGSVGNIFFYETASNPNGYMLDPSVLPQLRKAASASMGGLMVIADNTWLSSAAYVPPLVGVGGVGDSPSEMGGADAVVISMTKYYSGGTAIGGAILTNNATLAWDCGTHMRVFGMHTSPNNARLIHKALATLDYRVARSSELTAQIVAKLREKHPTLPLTHASLPDHPSHELMRQVLSGGATDRQVWYPSVFTFKVKGSKNAALRAMQSTHLAFKTSFGAPKSRFDPWPYKDGDYIVCRLAVGYNDELERVVSAVEEVVRLSEKAAAGGAGGKAKPAPQQKQQKQQQPKAQQEQGKKKGGRNQRVGGGAAASNAK